MNKRIHKGFTLIEVAVIVSVIAIIASIIIVAYNQVQKDARNTARKNGAIALATALRRYHDDNNEYPNVCPGGVNVDCFANPYLNSYLVPKYVNEMPTQPNTSSTGTTYRYVRGTSPDSFGVLYEPEGAWGCVVGDKVDQPSWWAGWFGACSF